MRGTKLTAWRTPPAVSNPQGDTGVSAPQDSRVPQAQKQLLKATQVALKAVAADVKQGLIETVGVSSRWVEDDRASVILGLPPDIDTERIARAIDMENVEAWRDVYGRVHVGIGPWYSTKDVDQVVLSITKVVHVLLGLHATDERNKPRGFLPRMLASAAEIMALQKNLAEEAKSSNTPPEKRIKNAEEDR